MSPRSWSSATLVPCKDFARATGEKVAVADFWREWCTHHSSTIHWTSRKDQLNPSHFSLRVCSHWSMDLKLKNLCSWNAGGKSSIKRIQMQQSHDEKQSLTTQAPDSAGCSFLAWHLDSDAKVHLQMPCLHIFLSGFCCMKCDRSSHLLQKKIRLIAPSERLQKNKPVLERGSTILVQPGTRFEPSTIFFVWSQNIWRKLKK